MTWTIRRNGDASLPASHLIEITFKLPANFANGKVVNVTATHMKQGEKHARHCASPDRASRSPRASS